MGLTDFSIGVQGGLQDLLAKRLVAQKTARDQAQQQFENQRQTSGDQRAQQTLDAQIENNRLQRAAQASNFASEDMARQATAQKGFVDSTMKVRNDTAPFQLSQGNQLANFKAAGVQTGIDIPTTGGRLYTSPTDAVGTPGDSPGGLAASYLKPTFPQQEKIAADTEKAAGLQRQQAVDVETGRHNRAMENRPPSGAMGVGNPTDIQDISDGIQRGDDAPDLTRMYGKSAAVRAELDRRKVPLRKLQLDWQAAQTFTKSLNGQPMVQFQSLGDSVVNTIDELTDISDQLKQGNVQKYNQAKRTTVQQVFGNTPQSELAARYVTTTAALKEELAGLIAGGYAPQEAGFSLASEMLNKDYGVEDMKSALTQTRRLLKYRLNAPMNIQPMSPLGTGSQGGAANPAGGYDYAAIKQRLGMK